MARWNKGNISTPADPYGNQMMIWIRDVALLCQSDECLIWPYTRERTGYGRFGRAGKMVYAHRYICEWAYGAPPEPHYHAAHSCLNGQLGCVNPRHLRWATPAENQREGKRRLPHALGMAKAREIRSLKGNLREHEIAARFGISERTVRRIHYGEIWTGTPRKDGRPIPA